MQEENWEQQGSDDDDGVVVLRNDELPPTTTTQKTEGKKGPQRSFNQSFAYAVSISPLVGDRHAPFEYANFDLEEAIRGLKEEWRRLCDLCRTSIVFDEPAQLATCLRAIAADSEVALLRSHPDKCRLREGFDAERRSGGYRDVQLSVCLRGAAATALGVDQAEQDVDAGLHARRPGRREAGTQVRLDPLGLGDREHLGVTVGGEAHIGQFDRHIGPSLG